MQTKGEYTPGPWQIVPYGDGDSLVICAPNADWRICFMATPGESPHAWQTIKANARLIAAAPELLEACKSMIPSGVCLTNTNIPDDFTVALDCTMGDLRAVAAAIARAKGIPS